VIDRQERPVRCRGGAPTLVVGGKPARCTGLVGRLVGSAACSAAGNRVTVVPRMLARSSPSVLSVRKSGDQPLGAARLARRRRQLSSPVDDCRPAFTAMVPLAGTRHFSAGAGGRQAHRLPRSSVRPWRLPGGCCEVLKVVEYACRTMPRLVRRPEVDHLRMPVSKSLQGSRTQIIMSGTLPALGEPPRTPSSRVWPRLR